MIDAALKQKNIVRYILMEFVRNELLLHRLLLVDGVGRSGKVMLAEILTGLDRVEKQDYHEFLEYIPLAYKYGKISRDIAIAILRTQMDTELYKNMIGRSVNTRPTDYTSLYKYHTPAKYLKRQTDEDGPVIAQKVREEKPIYLNWCHDMIQKSDIVFEAFEDKVELIYINRRPIDIIYEWQLKNFGERMASDPTEMQYIVQYQDDIVPELAIGWEEEYLGMKPLERIVRLIYESFIRNSKALENSGHKDGILVVNFEELVTDTNNQVNRLSQFLGLEVLPQMGNILHRENCPRILHDDEYQKRKDNIYAGINSESIAYIEQMDELYAKISSLAK